MGEIDQAATCKDGLQVRGDWQRRLANRGGMGDHPRLNGTGGALAQQASAYIDADYDRWHARAINAPSPVERHHVKAVGNMKALTGDALKRSKWVAR